MDPELLQKVGTLGLEYFGKYYSVYEGIVEDNDDPQIQGRIKVSVPGLGRDEPLQFFAYPVAPFTGSGFGFFFPPEVGELVWVIFHGGNPSLPLYIGGWWKRNNVPPEARRSGPPKVRVLRTKAGHRLIFDEEKGITLQTPQGTIVRLKDAEQKIEIIATQEVKVQAASAKVEATSVDVMASSVNVNSPLVRINSGTKFAAAIGDGVSGAGPVVGPPSAGRPLIP
jgi:phage baseplate assembly protein gpV